MQTLNLLNYLIAVSNSIEVDIVVIGREKQEGEPGDKGIPCKTCLENKSIPTAPNRDQVFDEIWIKMINFYHLSVNRRWGEGLEFANGVT